LTVPISSDAIEAALSAGWRDSMSAANGTGHLPARASVLTLVACVDEPSEVDAVLNAIDHLARLHPSRTVILLPDAPAGAPELTVWTRTTTVQDSGYELPVCAEQIVVAARDHAPHHLPSLADQLILPDLPAFLWWTGDVLADQRGLFGRLAGLTDRVIVDSAEFELLDAAVTRLSGLVRDRDRAGALSDVNWARLTPWRELLAQFFDAPAAQGRHAVVDRLVIDINPRDQTGVAQAMLLVGWLASCLGWRSNGIPFSPGVPHAWLRRPDGQPVEVIVQAGAAGPDFGITRIELDAGPHARFVATRDGEHATTETFLPNALQLTKVVRFDPGDVSALLADELMLFSRDRVYEKVLTTIARLIGEQE
jgi:glucose-6-phosphate dehydrogenase assembly protein OpcA